MSSGTGLSRKCNSCGGNLTWRGSKDALECSHCGNMESVPRRLEKVLELPFTKDFQESTPQKHPTAFEILENLKCTICGAESQLSPNVTAQNCPFCGSSQVKKHDANVSKIPPQGVWPFAIEEPDARKIFKDWLSKLWFRPNDLKNVAQLHSLKGVYVPYWTFDSKVTSHWKAERGDYYYEQYKDQNGELKQRQLTRWSWVSGVRNDEYDDILVCASQGLPRNIADKFTSFRTNESLPFQEEYLLGWITERYSVPLATAHDVALERMEKSQRNRCAQDTGGDTYRNLDIANEFSRETFKHLLLPIWICVYQYQQKKFQFYVNARTGEVYGEAPYSITKIILASLAAVTLLIWFFGFTRTGQRILQQLIS
jgi:predicted RNA-binding Zn-ribbon protein involved in translation (DUF1610 family)